MSRRSSDGTLHEAQFMPPTAMLDVERCQSTSRHNTLPYLAEKPGTETTNLVEFDGPSDPQDPLSWPLRRKIFTTLLYGLTTFGASWASSIYTSATGAVADEFHISREVSTLGLTLFLFGFATGPLLWAPLSEVYGRKVAVIPAYFVASCFCFGTAAAKDVQTVMLTRFFFGYFSSAPVTCTGGVLGDIWSPQQRAVAMVGYAMSVVGGPIFSPIVGAALVNSYLGWRWTHYLTGIMTLAIVTLDTLFIKESQRDVLLVDKARRLRLQTGDWALHAKHEERSFSLNELANKYLVRPFRLLVTPICFLMVLYSSFCYSLLYLVFSAFAIEFGEVRGWTPVVASLPLISIFIGCAIGGGINFYNQRFYLARFKANNNKAIPEARLPPMIVGSFALVAGLFIFAWTSSPHIHWIGSCIGAVLMGLGFFTVFQGSVNYLVDTFHPYGASAIAANTVIRNCLAGVFPLFTEQMFHNMGVDWASTLLGFLSLLMLPIPFFFYLKGKEIRARGEWSRPSTL